MKDELKVQVTAAVHQAIDAVDDANAAVAQPPPEQTQPAAPHRFGFFEIPPGVRVTGIRDFR